MEASRAGTWGRSGSALRGRATGALLLIAGCSAAAQGDGESSCAWQLSYDSRTYQSTVVGDAPSYTTQHQGPLLGQGQLAGCADGPTADQKVSVYAITGVSPAQAVITQDGTVAVTDLTNLPPALVTLLPDSPAPATGTP